jgi:hypothetical protein
MRKLLATLVLWLIRQWERAAGTPRCHLWDVPEPDRYDRRRPLTERERRALDERRQEW